MSKWTLYRTTAGMTLLNKVQTGTSTGKLIVTRIVSGEQIGTPLTIEQMKSLSNISDFTNHRYGLQYAQDLAVINTSEDKSQLPYNESRAYIVGQFTNSTTIQPNNPTIITNREWSLQHLAVFVKEQGQPDSDAVLYLFAQDSEPDTIPIAKVGNVENNAISFDFTFNLISDENLSLESATIETSGYITREVFRPLQLQVADIANDYLSKSLGGVVLGEVDFANTIYANIIGSHSGKDSEDSSEFPYITLDSNGMGLYSEYGIYVYGRLHIENTAFFEDDIYLVGSSSNIINNGGSINFSTENSRNQHYDIDFTASGNIYLEAAGEASIESSGGMYFSENSGDIVLTSSGDFEVNSDSNINLESDGNANIAIYGDANNSNIIAFKKYVKGSNNTYSVISSIVLGDTIVMSGDVKMNDGLEVTDKIKEEGEYLEDKYSPIDHKHTLGEILGTGSSDAVVPIENGGTGADNATTARSNLGLGDASIKGVSTTVSSGDVNLITGGAVYTALSGKADSVHSHNISDLIGATNGDNQIPVYDTTFNMWKWKTNPTTNFERTENITNGAVVGVAYSRRSLSTLCGTADVKVSVESGSNKQVIHFLVNSVDEASNTKNSIKVISNKCLNGAIFKEIRFYSRYIASSDSQSKNAQITFIANTSLNSAKLKVEVLSSICDNIPFFEAGYSYSNTNSFANQYYVSVDTTVADELTDFSAGILLHSSNTSFKTPTKVINGENAGTYNDVAYITPKLVNENEARITGFPTTKYWYNLSVNNQTLKVPYADLAIRALSFGSQMLPADTGLVRNVEGISSNIMSDCAFPTSYVTRVSASPYSPINGRQFLIMYFPSTHDFSTQTVSGELKPVDTTGYGTQIAIGIQAYNVGNQINRGLHLYIRSGINRVGLTDDSVDTRGYYSNYEFVTNENVKDKDVFGFVAAQWSNWHRISAETLIASDDTNDITTSNTIKSVLDSIQDTMSNYKASSFNTTAFTTGSTSTVISQNSSIGANTIQAVIQNIYNYLASIYSSVKWYTNTTLGVTNVTLKSALDTLTTKVSSKAESATLDTRVPALPTGTSSSYKSILTGTSGSGSWEVSPIVHKEYTGISLPDSEAAYLLATSNFVDGGSASSGVEPKSAACVNFNVLVYDGSGNQQIIDFDIIKGAVDSTLELVSKQRFGIIVNKHIVRYNNGGYNRFFKTIRLATFNRPVVQLVSSRLSTSCSIMVTMTTNICDNVPAFSLQSTFAVDTSTTQNHYFADYSLADSNRYTDQFVSSQSISGSIPTSLNNGEVVMVYS